MIYPVVVVLVAILILCFIMWKIVPTFKKMFDEFELKLPACNAVADGDERLCGENYWFMIILMPLGYILLAKLLRKFTHGRMGYDHFVLKVPIFGNLIEKNILARTTRTLGTLVSSGVPILEALNITKETAGNALFEKIFTKVIEAIRQGDVISKPMAENSTPGFHPMALFYWALWGSFPGAMVLSVALTAGRSIATGKNKNAIESLIQLGGYILAFGVVLSCLGYMMKMRNRVIDDLVVNMVDVGEETGELDTMLYKVADNYDEEVRRDDGRFDEVDRAIVDRVPWGRGRFHSLFRSSCHWFS